MSRNILPTSAFLASAHYLLVIFLAMKLRKFPCVTFKKKKKKTLTEHGSHLVSICAGHLEPEEIPTAQGMTCVNEITFSCTLEKSQEHLSDQTSPFVLFLQVFLIKNVIFLINCLNAPQLGLLFSRFCALWFSQGTESERKWDSPLNPILSAWIAFHSLSVLEWELGFYRDPKCSIFPAFSTLSSNTSCQILPSNPDIRWWQCAASDCRLKGGIIKTYFPVIYFCKKMTNTASL